MTISDQPRGNSFSVDGRAVHNAGAFAPATQSPPESGSLLVPSDGAALRDQASLYLHSVGGIAPKLPSSATPRFGTALHELLELAGAERMSSQLPNDTVIGAYAGYDDRGHERTYAPRPDEWAERAEYNDELRFRRQQAENERARNAKYAAEDEADGMPASPDASVGAAIREQAKPAGGLLHEAPKNSIPAVVEPDVDDPDIEW